MARTALSVRHPIVCGTDFTAQAAQAANVAAGLAVALEHPLLLVHASPSGRPRRESGALADAKGVRESLRREAERLRARGADVTTELHQGHADEVLTERARGAGAILIVIGALGSRVATKRRLGSIAERTAETASVPTLVVRNAAPFETWLKGARPLRVFLGFDFTVTADAAADWVGGLAKAGRLDVTVGHANRPSDDQRRFGVVDRAPAHDNSPRLQELIERQLRDRLLSVLGDGGADLRVQPSGGPVDVALVRMAVDVRADLVVVGTHQRHGLARLWSGSVSRSILSEAPTSVVVVPVATAGEQVQPVPAFTRVLVATDIWPQSRRVIAHACAVAGTRGIIRVAHVVHPRAVGRGEYETTLGRSDRHLRHVRGLGRRLEAMRPAAARELGFETEAVIVESEDAVTGICQEAERFDADVIVVGTKGAGPGKALLGSVAAGVLARCGRPVLVVSPRKE